ncbi:MAG: P1 family peptidase [Thalassobaculum sp.]|uniref:DmpA family aminopeptidase n=1 Tax=Thalassobaculum sp. TaxID=2022740 RepID=UPI0032EC1D28
MDDRPRLRDLGVTIGTLPAGPGNAITDVAGVAVGHVTLSDGAVQTGVTAVIPHAGHPFRDKLPAAVHVVNGFGKSAGLMQLAELGTLETPVVLTNTLSVGTASTALVRHMLETTPEIGASTGTVNPIVMECNDGAWLNDIRGLHVGEEHVLRALAEAGPAVEEGNLGAGTGMSCYGLAGGIGTASRVVARGPRRYALGALTLCNMGRMEDLRVDGRPVGRAVAERIVAEKAEAREQGSIIVLLATDAPLDARQLRRLAVRGGAGIGRTGTHFGSGSGDVVLAFATAETVPHAMPEDPEATRRSLHEDAMDPLFRAAIEAVEEAILNALLAARPTRGKQGRRRRSLAEFAELVRG